VALVVGVTGGIGSGKTTVTRLFEQHGAGVVDTDEIARALTAPGGEAISAIRARFGEGYLEADGGLDRGAMRALAFRDPAARRDLEAILHPMIRAHADRMIDALDTPYVLLVIPLLVETGGKRCGMTRVLVIDCPEQVQIERVVHRSGLSVDQVKAIMAAQATRAQRLAHADDIIDNSGDQARLAVQVDSLHRRYVSLAEHA
jgi:dephospho-CoA kinase